MIKLHWWNRGPRAGNFGDELSRWLVERLSGQSVEWAPVLQADLIAIGSLLEPHFVARGSWSDFSGAVWGAGRMASTGTIDLRKAHIAAVRGRQTLGAITTADPKPIAIADPALLVHRYLSRGRGIRLGIVPHHSECGHPFFQTPLCTRSDARVIDPCAGVDVVLEALSHCEYILSSSLHGIVVADALGIPNGWLRLGTGRERAMGYAPFKYHDYFSTFDEPSQSMITPRGDETLDVLLSRFRLASADAVERLCNAMVSCFPFASAPRFS